MNLTSRFANLENLRNEIARLRDSPSRFLLAVVLALSALLLTFVAQWLLGSGFAAAFAPVVIAATTLFGAAAGFCAAFVSFLVVDFFFLAPVFHLSWGEPEMRCALSLALLVALTHFVERHLYARRRALERPPLGLQGHFDGLEDGVVSGWAIDADRPTEPVLVSLFVNDEPIAEVAAVHHRSDVAATLASSGHHGFYVDVRQHLTASREVLIDAYFPNGNRIPNAPVVFTNSSGSERQPRTILFMHIPKTAGTAFREAIAANFNLSEIAYIYPTAPGFLISDLRSLPWKQRRSYRIVIGHYQFGMHYALPQESEYITIVREPAARVLSQYAYLAERQPELVSREGQLLSLEQLFETRLSVDLDNALVRCFSGVDQNVFPPGTLTSEIYELAVHNLRTAFTFVGHQETSSRAYAWLCQHFGWHAVPDLTAVNRGIVRPALSVPASTLDLIRHFNRLDFLLHSEICRLFPQTPSPLTTTIPS